MYEVTLDLGSEVLTGKGETLIEAFNALKFKENPKVLKSILTIKKGNKKVERVFNSKKTKLFAAYELNRLGWAKFYKDAL